MLLEVVEETEVDLEIALEMSSVSFLSNGLSNGEGRREVSNSKSGLFLFRLRCSIRAPLSWRRLKRSLRSREEVSKGRGFDLPLSHFQILLNILQTTIQLFKRVPAHRRLLRCLGLPPD